jgi:hypothetical protein
MRVLGLAMAAMLVLAAAMGAQAAALGSSGRQPAPAPGIIQVWGGCGWGWHPIPGHWSRWRGACVPPHCAPNRNYGGWGPYRGWGGPYYGGQGACGGWRGPYGGGDYYGSGWGNP